MRTNIRDRLLSGGKGPVLMFSYHHSLVHTFFFFSQYIPVVLQPTFMHFFLYFSHLRCPCHCFIPNSVQIGDFTHPSNYPHFCHIQLDARKQLFAQDCRTIDALTPTRAALIQHAKRATCQDVYCWGKMAIAAPALPSPNEWECSGTQLVLGNILGNSPRGDSATLACRQLLFSFMKGCIGQCMALCYCIGLCAHD